MVTKAWKLMCPSIAQNKRTVRWNWSGQHGDGTRIMEVFNADTTGHTSYIMLRITRDTEDEVEDEFEGQISDGYFEDCRGDIRGKEIDPKKIRMSAVAVKSLVEKALTEAEAGRYSRWEIKDALDTLSAIMYCYGIDGYDDIIAGTDETDEETAGTPEYKAELMTRLVDACNKILESLAPSNT